MSIKKLQIQGHIVGLVSAEQFVQIRWNELQRARQTMASLQATHKRSDCPTEWSRCRKLLNSLERNWKVMKGEL